MNLVSADAAGSIRKAGANKLEFMASLQLNSSVDVVVTVWYGL